MIIWYRYLYVMLILSLLSACSTSMSTPLPLVAIASATGVPALPSPTHPRSTTVTPMYTSIPSTHSATPDVPTVTPTPQGLNPDGPYVMFETGSGIWITNPDGTFATRLIDYHFTSELDLHVLVSPAGDRLALVVSNDQGLDLVMIQIPDGETRLITHLIDAVPPEVFDPVSPNSFATYAIRDYNSIAWQPPDGRLLAFTGAINGSTSDLYLYDTLTGEITQLTDGPSQAVMPVWSPDGQYILHFGVSWVPPFGGAIIGANQFDGVWAVRVSDGEVISLPKNMGNNPDFIGWYDDNHYITFDTGECSSQNLHTVDVATGVTTPLMEASFYYYIAQSPENGAILFSSAEGCEDSLGEGVFLLSPGQDIATRVHDKKAWAVHWLPESQVFDAYPEGLLSADGRTYHEPPVYEHSYKPAVSSQGYQAWEVIEDFKGRVEVRVPGGDWQTVLDGSIDALIWDPLDGQTLLIALSDGSILAADHPNFVPRLVGRLGDGVYQVIWSP